MPSDRAVKFRDATAQIKAQAKLLEQNPPSPFRIGAGGPMRSGERLQFANDDILLFDEAGRNLREAASSIEQARDVLVEKRDGFLIAQSDRCR